MKQVAIIKSTGANYASIASALTRLGVSFIITEHPDVVVSATHVILPGVGSAGYAMDRLNDHGLIPIIKGLKQPVLGICLGQQLLCTLSEEGHKPCLGVIPIQVKKLVNTRIVPHMGWNNLNRIKQDDPLMGGISCSDDFYFVHSFACQLAEPYTVASCEYGSPFSAVINKDNFYGVQFHPEKSGSPGLTLLSNFMRLS